MEEAAQVAKLMQLIYFFMGLIVTFAVWLARQAWILRQLIKEHKATQESVKDLTRDMNTRRTNEAVYKTMLEQIIRGQDELKKDVREAIHNLENKIERGRS